jgi:hypothetical protein
MKPIPQSTGEIAISMPAGTAESDSVTPWNLQLFTNIV